MTLVYVALIVRDPSGIRRVNKCKIEMADSR